MIRSGSEALSVSMSALGNVGYASFHATVKVRMSSDRPEM